MATFIQGVTDNPLPLQLYTPDYNFLTQVYGTRQAEYDRGFNAFKGLLNSTLNSPLQNSDNEQHRQIMFKKVQGALKDLATMDLSNPANVNKATSLLDPIVQDKEIAYDMYVTRHHAAERQKMENYRNSTDEKIRKQYNEYSLLDMQFADADLRNAKRGDGSILKVQPRGFVPFEDVEEYLSTQAKEQKLEVTKTFTENGYIHTVKNGDGAIIPYTQWARMMMGNKFDPQFQVMGRVNSESAVRSLAQQNGITNEQARVEIASVMQQEQLNSLSNEYDEVNRKTNSLGEQLAIFEKVHGNKIPEAYQKQYQEALQSYENFKNAQTGLETQIKELEKTDPATIVGRLNGVFEQQVKSGVARSWANSVAKATEHRELKADEVVLTKWKIASDERQTQMRINSAERIAEADRQVKLAELDQKVKDDQRKYELEIAKAKGKGEIAWEENLGTNPQTGTTSHVGYEAFKQASAQNKEELYRAAFGAETGLLALVAGDNYNKYSPIINKLMTAAKNRDASVTFSDAEAASINELYKQVGFKGAANMREILNDNRFASRVLNGLIDGLYTKGRESLVNHRVAGNQSGVTKHRDAFNKTIVAMEQSLKTEEALEQKQKKIHEIISSDRTTYGKAKIIGLNSAGIPIYDLSAYNNDAERGRLTHLDPLLGAEFTTNRPTGDVIKFNKLSDAELYNLVSSGSAGLISGDSKVLENMKNLPLSELKTLLADEAVVHFDPVSKKVVVKINMTSDATGEKKLNATDKQPLMFELNYEDIESRKSSLPRFNEYIQKYQITKGSIGMMEPFLANPTTSISSSSAEEALGFSYSAAGTYNSDGVYGINLTFDYRNPQTGKQTQISKFVPIKASGRDGGQEYNKVTDIINEYRLQYDQAVKAVELNNRK
jgi:hypothetical protein